MKALPRSELFLCPYGDCGKGFVKPLLLVDSSQLLRETYYACPHCHSKLDVTVEDSNVIRLEKCEGERDDPAPVTCAKSFGHLGTLDENVQIPDECLTCPKILQCSLRK